MKKNSMKAKLRDGKNVVGTFVYIPDPGIPELLGGLGYDFVILDMEHSATDWMLLQDMIRGCELGGVTPVVRMANGDIENIGRALDLGAQGIILPHIRSVDEAQAFAAALRYPPQGNRGACSVVRASRYFLDDWADHQIQSNEEVFGIGLIEDACALGCVTEIAAVPGLDALLVGRVDLGASMGVNGLGDSPALIAAAEQIRRDGLAGGAEVASILYDASGAAEAVAKGSRILIYSLDYKVLRSAYQAAITAIAAALPPSAQGTNKAA